MSPSSPPATALALSSLAELLHDATAGAAGPLLVTVDCRAHEVAFGTWEVPAEVRHPADPLVGFLAPAAWDAVGLVATGRARPLRPTDRTGAGSPTGPAGRAPADHEVGPIEPGPARSTVLAHRDGRACAVLEVGGRPPEVIDAAPEGWVADVLARALGRPTPPPAEPLAAWVEAAWLHQVAGIALAAPGRIRSWGRVARLHPLHPPGRVLPGALLAVETQAIDLQSSWTRMRLLSGIAPATTVHPPGGLPTTLADWFDDGSFSRWVLRDLPPAAELLPAVLDALPAEVGCELLDALVSVALPRERP